MISLVLKNRVVENKDWLTLLFIICFIIIGMIRNTHYYRYSDYIRLLISDKYTKIYKDSTNFKNWFTMVFFVLHILSLSFFIDYLFFYFLNYPKNDVLFFIRILTSVTAFILAKFLIEKIIAEIFSVNELIEHIYLLKISYRTYISLILLPVSLVLFYSTNPPLPLIIYIIISIVLLINLFIYIGNLKQFQNTITSNLYYFILYLCTLEIAPYFFAYHFFTKN